MQNHYGTRLGGWLLFFVVSICLGVGSLLFQIVDLLQYINFIFSSGFKTVLIFLLVIATAALFLSCVILIILRNPKFLLIYEIAICVGLVNAFLSEQDFFFGILLSLLGPILWRTYFHKSVRVQAYMGGDEYLRLSLLSRVIPDSGSAAGTDSGNYRDRQDNIYDATPPGNDVTPPTDSAHHHYYHRAEAEDKREEHED